MRRRVACQGAALRVQVKGRVRRQKAPPCFARGGSGEPPSSPGEQGGAPQPSHSSPRGAPPPTVPQPAPKCGMSLERESSLNLWCRNVNSRRPERARNEGWSKQLEHAAASKKVPRIESLISSLPTAGRPQVRACLVFCGFEGFDVILQNMFINKFRKSTPPQDRLLIVA